MNRELEEVRRRQEDRLLRRTLRLALELDPGAAVVLAELVLAGESPDQALAGWVERQLGPVSDDERRALEVVERLLRRARSAKRSD